MAAVFYAALSGALFGALAVSVRHALRRGADPYVGAVVVPGVAVLVAIVISAPSLATDEIQPSDLWPFAIAGLLVPGASQLLFIIAVRDAGPSRTSILIGTAPLMSVGIALAILGEPFSLLLAAGTALVVAGGGALGRERARPPHFRLLGPPSPSCARRCSPSATTSSARPHATPTRLPSWRRTSRSPLPPS